MKDYIIAKLEEENWQTPTNLQKMMKKDFNVAIEKILSLDQIIDIVKSWRKETNASKELYVQNNPLNFNNLIFLRVFLNFHTKVNENIKNYKIIIWCSDFQLNRLRMVNHFYIDGTFVVVPQGYKQLIVILIRDPNTDKLFPVLFALLNSKEEEAYYLVLKHLRDIITEFNFFYWNLEYATIDFEEGLQNAFQRVFPKTNIIGCLFHYRQALYRQAQSRRLITKAKKEETEKLISELGNLAWVNHKRVFQDGLEKIKARYKDEEYLGFLVYFEKNWLPRFELGQIQYSNKEDVYRSNSVLESYNNHIKNQLPRASSWPQFIEFLKQEDKKYFEEVFLAEVKGTINKKSKNFGKAYKHIGNTRKRPYPKEGTPVKAESNDSQGSNI